MSYGLLVINPGGVTTKVALYEGNSERLTATIEHNSDVLAAFPHAVDQLDSRLETINNLLATWDIDKKSLTAIVGRGGPLGPLEAGTYAVNDAMIDDIMAGRAQADHPSLIGALLAKRIADPLGLPAYIADPVSVDEMRDEARLSGLKNLPRQSLWHALNSRYAAKVACSENNLDYHTSRLVVAHLGSGISLSAHVNGQAVDVINPNDEGPFSPYRAGTLPLTGLVKFCLEDGRNKEELLAFLHRQAGLADLTGSGDLRKVEAMMDQGNEQARKAWEAMTYAIAKAIGSMAVACGKPDMIVLTGGLIRSDRFAKSIRDFTEFLGKVAILPGEWEMEALARAVLDMLNGREKLRSYSPINERTS